MHLEIENARVWSEGILGNCRLGDKRLAKRLVQIVSQLSSTTGSSLCKSCEGRKDLLEGSYRFIRNNRFKAAQIADGGYAVTACLAQTVPLLLAIEDTTSLTYSHEVSESLGYTTSKVELKKEGILSIQRC